MKKVIAVVGPTASGKTALSVAVAKAVGGEVICADSMQVYQEMAIATASATIEEQDGIPHHLLAFLDPASAFSVAEYVKLARAAIDDITARSKVPILCGGTGLFIDSLCENLQFMPEAGDPVLRENLFRQAVEKGNESLYQQLMHIDSAAAEKIHPNNIKRVVRALEVYYSTGVLFSEHVRRSRAVPSDLELLYLGIQYKDRNRLYDRIDHRVDLMMERGLLAEAEKLLRRTDAATCRQAIGHKELAPYFKGSISLEQAVEQLKRETRRYAKRQLTWFHRNEKIHWLYPDENAAYTQDAVAMACEFLKGAV